MMILKEKIEKTAKGNFRFRREEKLGPQASSRVTPCPPAPNQIIHLEEINRKKKRKGKKSK